MDEIALRYVSEKFNGKVAKREAVEAARRFGFVNVRVEQTRRFSAGTSVYLAGRHPRAKGRVAVIEDDGPRWLSIPDTLLKTYGLG